MASKMPVSALQELMAARGHALPVYVETGSGTTFTCTVHVEGITAEGHATNKKTAKHKSAENALNKLLAEASTKFRFEPDPVQRPLKNFIGELNEYSSKHCLHNPTYNFETILPTGQFIISCKFLGKVAEGRGSNKKLAKQDSARKMLKELESENPARFRLSQQKVTSVEGLNTDEIISMFKQLSAKDPILVKPKVLNLEPAPEIETVDGDNIEVLEELLKDLGIKYSVHNLQTRPYIVYLVIDDTNFTFIKSGSTRKEALLKLYKHVIEVKKSGCSFDLLNDFV